jgi:hypothetical protein
MTLLKNFNACWHPAGVDLEELDPVLLDFRTAFPVGPSCDILAWVRSDWGHVCGTWLMALLVYGAG